MAKKKTKRRKKQTKQKNLPLIQLVSSLLLLAVFPFVLIILANREPELPYINPYRAEDFVTENGFMKCLTTESIPGIDVSYYQGKIDWEQVRDSGVDFAMIRLGYRGYEQGGLSLAGDGTRRVVAGVAFSGRR